MVVVVVVIDFVFIVFDGGVSVVGVGDIKRSRKFVFFVSVVLVDVGIDGEDYWEKELEFFFGYGLKVYGVVVGLYVEVYVVLEGLYLSGFGDFYWGCMLVVDY